MAKKHPRSGKPAPGGRVTPKGVRPSGTTSSSDAHEAHDATPDAEPPRTRPGAADQGHGRPFVGQPAPTRAGHHRGQR